MLAYTTIVFEALGDFCLAGATAAYGLKIQ
jgi:hypothetical protein